jgi:hypothetical protein
MAEKPSNRILENQREEEGNGKILARLSYRVAGTMAKAGIE